MTVVFEHSYRGDTWRLTVDEYNGRTFANWRRWWPSEEGLRPSKDGCTFPPERLSELQEALGAVLPGSGTKSD